MAITENEYKLIQAAQNNVDRLKPDIRNKVEEVLKKAYGENYDFPKVVTKEMLLTHFQRCGYSNAFTPPYIESSITHLRHVWPGAPVIIRFPELKYANEAGNFLTLRDMYITFFLDQDGRVTAFSQSYFGALKAGIGPEGGFIHTHGGNAFLYGRYCYGSGPLMDIISYCYNYPYSDERFRALLAAMKAFFEFENMLDSRVIDRFHYTGKAISPTILNPDAIFENIWLKFKKHLTPEMFQILVGKRVLVMPTTLLNETLTQVIMDTTNDKKYLNEMIGSTRSVYLPNTSVQNHHNVIPTELLWFKGKPVYTYKVDGSNVAHKKKLVPHLNVINYVVEKVQKMVITNLIKKEAYGKDRVGTNETGVGQNSR